MSVLVLGGTAFVGRAIVDELLARGHQPTLLTRGRTGADLFPGVPRITGDRSGPLEPLGDWDAVVDVSNYVPRQVEQAAEALGAVGRYLLISTVSVYALDGSVLPELRDTEEITGETYGRLKVACENDAAARYGDRLTVVRPGIVAGPHDVTDRFTYWARRAPQGGRIAVTGRLDQPVQVVDSRDLANLCVQLLEDDRPGTFDAVGPADPVTLGELVSTCADGAEHELVELPADPVLPLVLPDPALDPAFRRGRAEAEAAGLTSTPLLQTARDTRAWDKGRGPLSVGLTAEREAELLARAATR